MKGGFEIIKEVVSYFCVLILNVLILRLNLECWKEIRIEKCIERGDIIFEKVSESKIFFLLDV